MALSLTTVTSSSVSMAAGSGATRQIDSFGNDITYRGCTVNYRGTKLFAVDAKCIAGSKNGYCFTEETKSKRIMATFNGWRSVHPGCIPWAGLLAFPQSTINEPMTFVLTPDGKSGAGVLRSSAVPFDSSASSRVSPSESGEGKKSKPKPSGKHRYIASATRVMSTTTPNWSIDSVLSLVGVEDSAQASGKLIQSVGTNCGQCHPVVLSGCQNAPRDVSPLAPSDVTRAVTGCSSRLRNNAWAPRILGMHPSILAWIKATYSVETSDGTFIVVTTPNAFNQIAPLKNKGKAWIAFGAAQIARWYLIVYKHWLENRMSKWSAGPIPEAELGKPRPHYGDTESPPTSKLFRRVVQRARGKEWLVASWKDFLELFSSTAKPTDHSLLTGAPMLRLEATALNNGKFPTVASANLYATVMLDVELVVFRKLCSSKTTHALNRGYALSEEEVVNFTTAYKKGRTDYLGSAQPKKKKEKKKVAESKKSAVSARPSASTTGGGGEDDDDSDLDEEEEEDVARSMLTLAMGDDDMDEDDEDDDEEEVEADYFGDDENSDVGGKSSGILSKKEYESTANQTAMKALITGKRIAEAKAEKAKAKAKKKAESKSNAGGGGGGDSDDDEEDDDDDDDAKEGASIDDVKLPTYDEYKAKAKAAAEDREFTATMRKVAKQTAGVSGKARVARPTMFAY
jgi:hypothetical protein